MNHELSVPKHSEYQNLSVPRRSACRYTKFAIHYRVPDKAGRRGAKPALDGAFRRELPGRVRSARCGLFSAPKCQKRVGLGPLVR